MTKDREDREGYFDGGDGYIPPFYRLAKHFSHYLNHLEANPTPKDEEMKNDIEQSPSSLDDELLDLLKDSMEQEFISAIEKGERLLLALSFNFIPLSLQQEPYIESVSVADITKHLVKWKVINEPYLARIQKETNHYRQHSFQPSLEDKFSYCRTINTFEESIRSSLRKMFGPRLGS